MWNIDEKGKKEAVAILLKKDSLKIDDNNLEIVSLKIWYCISFYLDLYKKNNDISYKTKLENLNIEGNRLIQVLRQGNINIEKNGCDTVKEAILSIISLNCVINSKNENELKKMKYCVELYKNIFNPSYNDRIFDLDKEVQKTLADEGANILKIYNKEDVLEAQVIKVTNKYVKCKVKPNYVGCIFSKIDFDDFRRGDSIFVKIRKISKYNEIEFSYEGFNS